MVSGESVVVQYNTAPGVCVHCAAVWQPWRPCTGCCCKGFPSPPAPAATVCDCWSDTPVCVFCRTAQPGQYPDAFVNEFKVFIVELRDFFNAAGLTSLLDEVKKSLGDENKQVRPDM